LLDPRHEDPLAFLMLDLRDTFHLVPVHDPGTTQYLRASYTIDVLRLNRRDLLVEARRDAFGGYRARLSEYVLRRDIGAAQDELERLANGFRTAPHATVWVEMKRQHRLLHELSDLFARVPEALDF
jgi:hypothetical protein